MNTASEKIYQNITQNLTDVARLDLGDIGKYVYISQDIASIGNKKNPIASFCTTGVFLANTDHHLEIPESQREDPLRRDMLWQVIKSLETNKISLNHAGIGYTPENIDTEIEKIIGIVKQSTHKIYEDPTGPEADMRWVFIGDTTDHGPMFEIVLPEKKLNMRPHMQFDIDTDLSPDEVQERISENFGDDMLDWDLDIPGVGRVLSMGTYANTGLDMRIGIGTNLRSRKTHRESLVEL